MNFFKTTAAALVIAAITFTGCRKDEPANKVTGVSLNESTLTLLEGQTATLVATVMPDDAADKTVTWAVTEGDAATVSDAGVVTAVKAGTATITVTTADGGKTATCAITVKTEETETSLERSNRIGKAGGEMIETAIAEAYTANAPVNVESILEEVKGIPGILSAELTPSGTNISIEMNDHTQMNMQIVSPTDERFFPPVTTESKSTKIPISGSYAKAGVVSAPTLKSIENNAATQPNYGPKNGEKYRMLVLAPFWFNGMQTDDFEENITAAGFAGFTNQDGGSHIYKDEKADLEKFRGDFLNDFDYVLIYTHGYAEKANTFILTGRTVSDNEEPPHEYVQSSKVFGVSPNLWAVSPAYVEATLNGEDFAGTHVFLAACETTQHRNGTGSFVDMFMGNDAESIIGFDNVFAVPAVRDMIKETFAALSYCNPLEPSVEYAKSVIGLVYWGLDNLLFQFISESYSHMYDEEVIYFKQKPDASYSFCAEDLPAPITLDATDIQSGRVTLNGMIPRYGGAGITERGFAVAYASDPNYWENVKDENFDPATFNSDIDNEYSISFQGLLDGLEVLFRAYVVLDGNEYHAEEYKSFTTKGDENREYRITMTTAIKGRVSIRLASTVLERGTVAIDWGDGSAIEIHGLPTYENDWVYDLNNDYRYYHTFSDATPRTISIAGRDITHLDCNRLQLTALDVTNNDVTNNIARDTVLTELWCGYNSLTSLNVSNCVALTVLYCYYNELTGINVSNCTALTKLYCDHNQLTSLDLSDCTALTNLWCYNNELTNLNVSNSALTVLECDNNQLTNLNVSTTLEELDCDGNQLTSLDVSNCTALRELDCGANQLTSLNVNNCTALRVLDCNVNQLTRLDVTKSTALEWLFCRYNQLTTEGLNTLFGTLHSNAGNKTIEVYDNPGTANCNSSIAEDKGWTVDKYF